MSLCPLLGDAGLPGHRGYFPEACMMEAVCCVVNKQSVECHLWLCVCPPTVLASTQNNCALPFIVSP